MKRILLLLLAILPAFAMADTHKVHYSQVNDGTFAVKYKSGYYYLPKSPTTASFTNDTVFDEGTSIQIYAKAPTGKSIESLTVNDTEVKSSLKSGYYTFTVGTEDVNIVCTFEGDEPEPVTTFAVTGTVEGEGTLNLQYMDGGWLDLKSGTELATGTWVRICPKGSTGYNLTSLTKNGTDILSSMSGSYYSCQVEKEALAFVAKFEKDETVTLCPVKITLHKGPGVVEKVVTQYSQEEIKLNYPTENEVTVFKVNQGEYLNITMEPSEDCYIKSLLFNNTEYVSRVSSSTTKCTWRTPQITSETDTTKIEIFFDLTPEPSTYTVNFSVNDAEMGTMRVYNGTSEVKSGDTFTENTTLHAVFDPADGYELSALTVNGKDAIDYVYQLTFDFAVDDNLNIIATFAKIEEEPVEGDVNEDGEVDVADVAAILSVMYGSEDHADTADVNGDGAVDVSDVTAVLNIMYE